jgi:hypothetical protein
LRTLLAAAVLSLAIGSLVYQAPSMWHAGPVARRARPVRALARAGLLSLPLSARAPVSAALGAASPAYRVTSTRDGLSAANPVQRLSSRFTAAGVSVSSGATRLGLQLQGAGYGSSLLALAEVAPSMHGDRVVYQHPGVTEWYANGPLGLEQGFTVTSAPSHHASGPLTLAIALAGNSRPALAPGAQTISFSRGGHTVLRYSGLSVTDAAGHPLHSWLALQAGRILLRVNAAGARYPLHIDPFVQVGKALTGEGEFGDSVALSGNGNTALIGAPVAKSGDGEALVFKRAGEKWTQEGEPLVPEGETGAGFFGQAVALSANGDYALIGAPNDNSAAGAAWAFVRVGEKWEQQSAKLTGEGGEFGSSVALSGEGTNALIGSPSYGKEEGAAWAFQRSAEKWSETQKITGAGGEFGWSVAVSPEGKTALISVPFKELACPEEGIGGKECGAVYVYSYNAVHSEWTETHELVASEEIGEGFFGWSVALSREGNVALIGAPHEAATFPGNCAGTPVAPECEGAAYVFTQAGEKWSQQARLTGREETKLAEFGYSVALSANGSTALIGGRRDNEKVGAAWEFTRTGSAWTQRGAKITGSGESGKGFFGFTVALSEEGDVGLIGAPENGKERGGAVWTFEDAADTDAATEVTPKTATLNATTDPNGEEVTECKFEYGTTTSYGSIASCAKLPGSGPSPVAVSASLAGLSEDVTYHLRVSATNALGTHLGGDETFTTLQTSKAGSTKEAEKPAEATDGQLSVKASSGTGTITVGTYGSNPGGTRLLGSKGGYTDVYQSSEGSFSKIEYKDCELNGATVLYWFNPQAKLGKGEWQKVSKQTYLAGSPACIEVEAEASGTSPTVSQMNGTRFGDAAQIAGPEFGRCAAAPSRKEGSKTLYEGYFSSSTCTGSLDEAKTGAPEGKYEWEVEAFAKAAFTTQLTSGLVTLESASKSSKVTCDGESSSGEYVGLHAIEGVVITLTDCAKASEICSSAGRSAGEVVMKPLEGVLGVEKKGTTSAKDKIALALYPIAKTGPLVEFSCGSTSVLVRGAVLVPIKADKGYPTQALKFAATKGKQKPEGFEGEPKEILEESFNKGASYEQTGLTAAITQTNKEDVEVNAVW